MLVFQGGGVPGSLPEAAYYKLPQPNSGGMHDCLYNLHPAVCRDTLLQLLQATVGTGLALIALQLLHANMLI